MGACGGEAAWGRGPGESFCPASSRGGGTRALQEKAHFPSCFSHTSARTVTIDQGRRLARGERSLVSKHSPLFPFQDTDKFGNEITQLARPLPVEYLIIDVSAPGPGARRSQGCGGKALAQAKALEGSWLPEEPSILRAFSFSFFPLKTIRC